MLTSIRLIPLPVHTALRMATGMLTMLAPFLAGFQEPAMVLSVAVGAIVTGVALTSIVDENGRSTMPVSTVHTLDYALVLGLFAVAVVVGLAGDAAAAGVLCAIALVQFGGNVLTKYSLHG